VDNTTNGSQEEIGYLFILFKTLDKFLYHILPIIHAYNAGISRLRSYTRLRSHARLRSYIQTSVPLPDQTLVDVTTSDVSLDSGRASWLRSMSMSVVLPPQL
jgi:hypothetical protein